MHHYRNKICIIGNEKKLRIYLKECQKFGLFSFSTNSLPIQINNRKLLILLISLLNVPLAFCPLCNELCIFCCLSSCHCSPVRPTRHYTVFLSEDSSGDELQYDNESISGFPDSFFFSVPFEWSPLYAFP